jgi:hypothetical protein
MIDNYCFGKITVDGIEYQKDIIIFPDHIMPEWWREKGHSLAISDLKDVIAAHPRVLVIGTGMFGRMRIPHKIKATLAAAGIEVIAEKTELACKIYNQKIAEGDIIAALHLTC